jgi:outer membrane protein TolC
VKKTAIVLTLLSLFASTLSFAEARSPIDTKPIPITLKDAVMLALRNNPDIKQDEITRIAQKFALVLAKNQFELQYKLDGKVGYTNTYGNKQKSHEFAYEVSPLVSLENHYGTTFSVQGSNPSTNGVYTPDIVATVTQPLIRGFGKPFVDAALNNAKDAELVNKLSFKNDTIGVVAAVTTDYLNLVQAYETLRVDQQSLKNYQETVSNDKILIKAGRMAKSEIVQAQAQVETQLSTIANDNNAIYQARFKLLNDLGLPPYANISVPRQLNFETILQNITGGAPIPSVETSEDIALAQNISYQTALITIREAQRSLLVARNGMLWRADLSASETLGQGGTGNIRGIVNGSGHEEDVSLNISIPIDDVSDQNTLIDQQVTVDNALIKLKDTKRKLIESIGTDYETIGTSKESLALSKEALKLQEQTVYISQQKQLAGQSSTFEVLSNQRNLATQQVSVVQNQITYLASIVAYETDLGVLLEPWHIKLKY